MSFLPKNLNLAALSATDQFKVEQFYRRFVLERYREYGDGHFLLACYASLPVVATSDLLYQLWLNLAEYHDGRQSRRIHRVAVADVLLSPLFDEVGYDTYSMPNPIKNALLNYWKTEPMLKPQVEVARLLLEYVGTIRTSDVNHDRAFQEAQEWVALSYLDPNEAEARLQEKMKTASASLAADRNDHASHANALQMLRRMEERYSLQFWVEGQTPPPGFQPLEGYSDALKSLVNANSESFFHKLKGENLHRWMKREQGKDLSVAVPEKLVRGAGEQATAQEQRRKLYALLVGVAEIEENRSLDLRYPSDNVTNVKAGLERLPQFEEHDRRLTIFQNEKATALAVRSAIQEMMRQTKPEDSVLFYFAGPGAPNGISLYDSTSTDNFTGIRYDELGKLLTSRGTDNPYVTIILDGVANEFDLPVSDKTIVITDLDILPDRDSAGASRLFFDILAQSKGRISLQKLMALAYHEEKKEAVEESPVYEQQSKAPTKKAAKKNPRQQAASSGILVSPLIRGGPRQELPPLLPRLRATPNAARRPFLGGDNPVLDIQYLLRAMARYEGSANGIYNKATDDALRGILAEKEQSLPQEAGESLTALRAWRDEGERELQPLCLLVFANPDERLSEIQREQKEMQEAFNAAAINYHLLLDPSKEELAAIFKDPANRNRLALFHYSGFEADPETTDESPERGLFLSEGNFVKFEDLVEWLDFQNNLKLVFLNTCYADGIAKGLTMRGVGAGIGGHETIFDDYSTEFAIQFYQKLKSGKALEEAFLKTSSQVLKGGYGAHRSAVSDVVRQGELQICFNWHLAEKMKGWRLVWNVEILKEELRELVAKDELQVLFERLDEKLSPEGKRYNDLIHQRASFNSVTKDVQNGMVSLENANLTFSRIRSTLLDLIGLLKDDDLKPEMRSKGFNCLLFNEASDFASR